MDAGWNSFRKKCLAITPIPALFGWAEREGVLDTLISEEGLLWVTANFATASLVTTRLPSTRRYRRALLRRVMSEADDRGVALPCSLLDAYGELLVPPSETETGQAGGGDDADYYKLFLTHPDQPPFETEDLVVGRDFVAVAVSSAFSDVGLALWPAAFVLAEVVVADPEGIFAAASSILELGAGVGLSGIFARSTLPPETPLVLTDIPGPVFERLQSNIALNFGSDQTNISPAVLDWETFDPHDNPFTDLGDVLIAADVVYDPSLADALVSVLASFLTSGLSRMAVIVSRIRRETTYDNFVALAGSAGLDVRDLGQLESSSYIFDLPADERKGIQTILVTPTTTAP